MMTRRKKRHREIMEYINFKRNKPRNDEIRLIWKQIEIKNKEGVSVLNRIHKDIKSQSELSYHNPHKEKSKVFGVNFLSSMELGKK